MGYFLSCFCCSCLFLFETKTFVHQMDTCLFIIRTGTQFFGCMAVVSCRRPDEISDQCQKHQHENNETIRCNLLSKRYCKNNDEKLLASLMCTARQCILLKLVCNCLSSTHYILIVRTMYSNVLVHAVLLLQQLLLLLLHCHKWSAFGVCRHY